MKTITKVKDLQLMANTIRQDIITSLTEAKSGHSAGPLGMTDIFTALYFNILKHNPKKPQWKDRDRVVLSNGHICPVLYATMANAGYFPKKELMTLRKLGTRLQGHPHREALPGLETTSGPLGSGLSQAAGMAYALKIDRKNNHVWCFCSDGEHNEGNTWEAMLFAAKHKLNNLIVILDRNYIQIDGNTEDIMPLDPLDKKYKAFNWNVVTINGHNMKRIVSTLRNARKNKNKPLMIIANTTPGKGVSFMENDYTWHGKPPTKEQEEMALAELRKREHSLEGVRCSQCSKLHRRCTCIEGQ
ncbi:transketolase [Candidatus Woesearchaeota archaeon]|jgi:transketolase|nr:transketolase [Candidatus Woesearchaeota archaeon]MBT5396724.1 transketolase [Candidatus Woesearchaeota archaeon]MBT6367489.1 transketolase [Candidatus Woesearchaeota archaeon]MBT7762988.1 transketolase [Candidatus Woesearchaeota archaeon]